MARRPVKLDGRDTKLDDNDEATQLVGWVALAESFLADLDRLPGDDPMSFCESATDAWQEQLPKGPRPSPNGPAALLIIDICVDLLQVASDAARDFVDTPDVRDRMTVETARERAREALTATVEEASGWLAGKPPETPEIERRKSVATSRLEDMQAEAEAQMTKDDADDARAAADPFGAILGYNSSNVDAAIIFTKVCSFTEREDVRYREAHERLRKMVDSELLRHVSDESDRFLDVVMAVLTDIVERRLSLSDQDAFDERRRQIRSALISFSSAIHSHREQSIRAARDKFGRNSAELLRVKGLFDELLESSFEYGWLNKMRDALLHGDINAFKMRLQASLDRENKADVLMDREYMLQFTKEAREKWLKRKELEDLEADPSVFDMIKTVQPLLVELQDRVDAIQYPDVAADTEIIRELIGRFNGRRGLYALQSGPGFTRRLKVPPYNLLAPRVLMYAQGYESESDESAESRTD